MKKIICLILSFFVLFSFSACFEVTDGGKDEGDFNFEWIEDENAVEITDKETSDAYNKAMSNLLNSKDYKLEAYEERKDLGFVNISEEFTGDDENTVIHQKYFLNTVEEIEALETWGGKYNDRYYSITDEYDKTFDNLIERTTSQLDKNEFLTDISNNRYIDMIPYEVTDIVDSVIYDFIGIENCILKGKRNGNKVYIDTDLSQYMPENICKNFTICVKTIIENERFTYYYLYLSGQVKNDVSDSSSEDYKNVLSELKCKIIYDIQPVKMIESGHSENNSTIYTYLTPQENVTDEEILKITVNIIRARLEICGVSWNNVTIEKDGKIKVEVDKNSKNEEVLKNILGYGKLTFKDYQGYTWLDGRDCVKSAYISQDRERGGFLIYLDLTEVGSVKLYEATKEIAGMHDGNNMLYVALDEKVISLPTIREAINSKVIQLEGFSTYKEALLLASVIESGELPAKFVQSEIFTLEKNQ